MKRTMIILALFAAAALLTAPAEAGLFKKAKKKGKPAETELAKTWRYDRLPTMDFHKGTLASTGAGAWKVGEVNLQLAPGCRIEGGESALQTGRTVVVMGPRVGNTIVAWQVDPQKPQTYRAPHNEDTQIVWSDTDPTVGEGHGPN